MTKETKWWVKFLFACLILAGCIGLAFACGGCTTAECGSRTIVGRHYALPKISNESSNTDVEVYESVEGATVYTRRDSIVEIDYENIYTNHILGCWNTAGSMGLRVKIKPLTATNACECATK